MDSLHTAGTELSLHAHPFACLHWIRRGTYKEVIDGQRCSVSPGTLLYKPPDVGHSNLFDEGDTCSLRIEIDPRLFGDLRGGATIPVHPVISTNHTALDLAHHVYCEARFQDDFSALSVEGLCLELLASIYREGRRPKLPEPTATLHQHVAVALAAAELLRARFRASVSLGDVAAALHVDRSVLARAFMQQHRCTMGEYVRRLRVAFTASLLAESSAALAEIAQDAGFADQSHFSRTFKRVTGMTPAAYRYEFSSIHKRSTANPVQDI